MGRKPAINVGIDLSLDATRCIMKLSQVLRGLFKNSGR